MDKRGIIKAVLSELERQKSELESGLASARQTALEAPGAMQSHSDTTKSQMHTLAANLEKMIKDKEAAIRYLNDPLNGSPDRNETISNGALIEIQDENNAKKFYLLVPDGGAGVNVNVGNIAVTSLTMRTPLGSALTGKKIGDTAAIQNKAGNRNVKILNVY